MAEQSDPIQAQLVEARRNQILDAATKVFAEKGFARATIKEIARVAGVADGTIYIYFKNKEDLILGLMHRINQSDQRAEDFAQAATQPAEDFSVAYFRQRMEFMGNQMATFQAILQEVLGNETLRKEYLEKVIEPTMTVAKPYFEALIANRTIRPIEPAMTINVITGSVLGVLLLRMLGYMNIEEQWEELPEVLFEILFKGLQPR